MQRTTASPSDTRPRDGAPERLLDDEDVARLLRCSARLVRKLRESRQLGVVKVGRLPRVERAEVERYIAAHRRPAVGS